MDSLTQALFGATVAQVGFRRTLGRRAMVAGAVLGTVPDLDVAVGWVADAFSNWQHHRGVTHSLFFGPLVGPILGWGIWKLERWRGAAPGAAAGTAPDDPARLRAWIWLAILALLTHPLIDLFTSYGTQLLAPLSDHRFAIDAMPIIEPIYSLSLILALLVGAFSRLPGRAVAAAAAALLFVASYTLYGWSLDARTERWAREQLAASGVVATSVDAYPMLFQPWYRRVVARTPDGLLVGYHTALAPGPIEWRRFARTDDPRTRPVAETREGRIFQWFAMGNVFWRVEPSPEGGAVVEALDTRYGMPGGSELGFWGIRARLDASGDLLGPPETFARRPGADGRSLAGYWRAVFGR
jgi:inner membrane protein